MFHVKQWLFRLLRCGWFGKGTLDSPYWFPVNPGGPDPESYALPTLTSPLALLAKMDNPRRDDWFNDQELPVAGNYVLTDREQLIRKKCIEHKKKMFRAQEILDNAFLRQLRGERIPFSFDSIFTILPDPNSFENGAGI
ncbi:MAG: hypothetical protein KAR42_17580 [candidate division Zixibacteria bacterium]|nr:hypothetical protein [candidate division Zixibacteria bacterium]